MTEEFTNYLFLKGLFLYRFANLITFAFVIDVIFLTKPAIIKSASQLASLSRYQ